MAADPGRSLSQARDVTVTSFDGTKIFREPLKEVPESIHDLARVLGADSDWHDVMPQLYSFLAFAHHEKLSLKERQQLFVAMADGITWDGQPIPGLPAHDADYLAKLTGDQPGN